MWIDRNNIEDDLEGVWTGHRERIRLRMEEKGFEGLKPHEQIEILLYHALPQKDLSEVSRNIINRFENIKGVIDADPDELMAIPGVTPAIGEWLLSVQELARAYLDMKFDDFMQIRNFRDSIKYISPLKKYVHPPESWMIYMDFDYQIMMRTVITPSLSWGEPEYVRDMIMDCNATNAKYAVLALFMGNLPLEPDEYEDIHLPPIARMLRAMDVELLDCVLVGESGYVSMNRSGFMDHIRLESEKFEVHERYVSDEAFENPCDTPEDI